MTRERLSKGHVRPKSPRLPAGASDLRRCAEGQLRERPRAPRLEARSPESGADSQRLLHELQVHQIELEMQNAELRECRDRADSLLDKYTDLYDFAPVGYFSLDEQSLILEANLTGADLLGVERSRFVSRRLSRFVALPWRTGFLDFLSRVFAGGGKQSCEARLVKEDGTPFWASLIGCGTSSPAGARRECRVAVSDITSLKQAQEAQRRTETLAVSNDELRREIVRRQAVEDALRTSERQQRELLEEARRMQVQLRNLSHSVLQTREEERKRISRELHDDITQILVGITVQLEALSRDATISPRMLKQKIARTQRLVEKSVNAVHQFAVELRPTSLDDLGLIVTLHAFLDDFMKRTGIRVRFTAFAGADQLSSDQRTALYRIVQSALANVAQHAQASRVDVSVCRAGDAVRLEVSDNGKAFDVERVLHVKGGKHLGLVGMRERAEMMGGTYTVRSTPGKGTTIQAQIPFRNGAKERTRT